MVISLGQNTRLNLFLDSYPLTPVDLVLNTWIFFLYPFLKKEGSLFYSNLRTLNNRYTQTPRREEGE
jgi:hypothetical protein